MRERIEAADLAAPLITAMWAWRCEELPADRGRRSVIEHEGCPVPYEEVLRLLRADSSFRSLFNSHLADAPYPAFRWETPPVTRATLDRPFELVLLDSPGLARRSDADAFAEHFGDDSRSRGVVEFANLGGDALMVVPCPLGPIDAYGHLAAFVRHAPTEQRHALWTLVAEVMARRLGEAPVWLSTAGAGVAWLHVRLDDRPKYYGHRPYRAPPA